MGQNSRISSVRDIQLPYVRLIAVHNFQKKPKVVIQLSIPTHPRHHTNDDQSAKADLTFHPGDHDIKYTMLTSKQAKDHRLAGAKLLPYVDIIAITFRPRSRHHCIEHATGFVSPLYKPGYGANTECDHWLKKLPEVRSSDEWTVLVGYDKHWVWTLADLSYTFATRGRG